MATMPYLDVDRFKHIPLSLPSLCTCSCRPLSSQSLILHRPFSKVNHIGFVFSRRKPVLRFSQNGLLAHRRVITAVAQAEPDRLGEGNSEKVLEYSIRISWASVSVGAFLFFFWSICLMLRFGMMWEEGTGGWNESGMMMFLVSENG